MASLSNKVALVTAGSAGLGAAIVQALASLDMRIVINYSQNSERAEAFVSSLSHSTSIPPSTPASGIGPARFVAIKADVGSRPDIIRLVDEAVSVMGRLDVVISNSGWTRMTDFNNLDAGVQEDDWDRCFNMNVKSHLFLLHASRKYLDTVDGCFISTASVAGIKPGGSSLVSNFHQRLIS